MIAAACEQQDANLREEADALIARHDLRAILRAYGTPHITGSYSLQLMTWRDLDVYLDMGEPRVPPFLDLGRRLGEALQPRKLSFTDHLNFPSTEAVVGLYWGIHSRDLAGGGWKIDLWGVSSAVCAERLAHMDAIRRRLTTESRHAILVIKNEVCRHPEYRKTITSQHVYDAVFDGGARSPEDFWRIHRQGEGRLNRP